MKDIIKEKIQNIKEQENDYIICSIVGNVDNGKTFLLDKLTKKKTKEINNITQKINYFVLDREDNKHIIFLDTPGHETFSFTKEICIDICDIVFLVVSIKDTSKSSIDNWINYFTEKNTNYIILISKLDTFKNISDYRKTYFQLGLNNIDSNRIFGIKYDEFKYLDDIELISLEDLLFFLDDNISLNKKVISPELIYVLNKKKEEKKSIEYLVLDLSNNICKNTKTNISILSEKVSINKKEKNLLTLKTKFDMSPGDLVIINDKNSSRIYKKEVLVKDIVAYPEQKEKFFLFSSSENKILALREIFDKLNLKYSKTILGNPDNIVTKMLQNGSIKGIFYDVKVKLKFSNIFSSENIYDIEMYLKKEFINKIEERKIVSKVINNSLFNIKVKAIFNIKKNTIAGCDVFNEITKRFFVSVKRKEKIIAQNIVIESMKNKLNEIEKTIPKTEVGFLFKDFNDLKVDDLLYFHNNLI